MINIKEFDLGRLMIADFVMRAIHGDLRRGHCPLNPPPPAWLRRLMARRLERSWEPVGGSGYVLRAAKDRKCFTPLSEITD